MKNLLLAFLMILSVAVLGQSFEGTLVWSIKTEITDPKVKKQMEQASDPAKVKEFEDQMNSPQFKKMMEQNPQMKEQMERTLAMMKSGGGMEAMMPTKIKVRIRKENSLTMMEGGMLDGTEVLYLKDKNESITINRKNKTYTVDKDDNVADPNSNAKVTKTNETKKVLNYTCTKYLVELNSGGKLTKQEIWATTEIKDLDFKALASRKVTNNSEGGFFYKEIDGVPLMMVMNSPEMNLTMQASEVKRESQPAGDFVIPSGFTEVKSPY